MRTFRTLLLLALSIGILQAKDFKKEQLKNAFFSADSTQVVAKDGKSFFLYQKKSADSYSRVREITADEYANPQALFGEASTTVGFMNMDPGAEKKPIKAVPLQMHPPGCTCGAHNPATQPSFF